MKRMCGNNLLKVKPCRRVIALTVKGLREPEAYTVSDDVFTIIKKLLALNQAVGPYRGTPLIQFDEVRFLLRVLGAPRATSGLAPEILVAED